MLRSQHYAIFSALYHLLRHLHVDIYAQWLLQNLQHSAHSDQMGGWIYMIDNLIIICQY